MKYLRFSLLAVVAMMVTLLSAQSNVLRVDSVKIAAGKTVSLPIVMENTSDIAGVQFDISVPYQLATDEETGDVAVTLSRNRVTDHTVAVRQMGTTYQYYYPNGPDSSREGAYYYKYRIIVYSETNALIIDNRGTLLTLQFTTPVELNNGAVLPICLSNVTLSDLAMQNQLTQAKDGAVTIEEIPRPDLTPADVTSEQQTVQPGGRINVAWHVKNVGQMPTEAGWSEQISLVTATGKQSKVIGTTRYEQTLAAGQEVSRQAEIELPMLLGVDGPCKVQVTVVPNEQTGEHASQLDNNTQASASNISVGKVLTLELSQMRVTEGRTQRITAKLSRSGRWNNVRTFTVTSTQDSRVEMPERITITADQSGAVFYITVNDNTVLDADSVVNISIEGDSYDPVTARLVIEDNELPAITLRASKSEITEGESFNLTAALGRASQQATVVTLTCENPRRFSMPSTLTIPAGELTGQVSVTATDNDTPDGTQTIAFTASSPNYEKGQALVIVNDNDLPVLQMTITPAQVQESSGPVSVAGVLKRLSNTDKKVTVKLTDDADGGLYFGNRTLTLDKGVETVYFNFGPVDNQNVDGDRTYTVTAAVWISSCSCDAQGEAAGHVSAQLQVIDDDGAALRLASRQGTVKEGGETTLTITRNNAPEGDLTVTLTSDFDDNLEYDHQVTIPAGQQSVDVVIRSKSNDVQGDSHTVIFTVSTEGYASGTCWVMVTDQTLPDALIANITVSPTAVLVGDPVLVSIVVANEGAAPLPAATQVKIYEKGVREELFSFVLDAPLPIDNDRTYEKTVSLPKSVGTHQLYAVINENNNVQELSVTNNTSATFDVEVSSPFMATLQTDKERYNQNDVIVFTGQLTGRDFADAEMDLYIICEGTRQQQRIRSDENGAFTYKWQLEGALSGHAIAGVCYPDARATAEITAFDIYGLRRYDTGYIKHQLTVAETTEASIRLVNPGILPLTGAKVEVVSKPDSYDVEASVPATITAGDNNVLLTYNITANAQSVGNQWEQVKLLVTSNEGIELPITMYTYARMAAANLVTPNQRITTTMTKGQVREYPIQLINNGQGNTGKVSLALPDWITCAQGSTLAGINVGDTATIVLRFKPTESMQLNVPVTGTIGFNVEYGNGTYANFSVTPVSDQTGTLRVVVADEYTYYTDEAPHVKDAQVVLRNSVTNAIVTIDGQPAQGTTGEDGVVTFENLPEGYYKLSVSADRHDSYTNNIIVDPGVTTTKVVNLSVEAIKVTWTVEETEVEDVYDIVTTVTYETNVPVPVVDLIIPQRIPADSLAEGESLVFYAIATNKGLITAQNSEITLPERTGIYLWEPLAENTGLTIAPQQSYILPVKVTRLTPTDSRMMRAGSGDNGCHTAVILFYEWECGNDRKYHKVERPMSFEVCPGKPAGGSSGGGGGGGLGSPGGGWGGGYGGSSYGGYVAVSDDCDPCGDAVATSLVNCLVGFTPAGCPVGLAECTAEWFDDNVSMLEKVFDCVVAGAGCFELTTIPAAVIACLKGFANAGIKCYEVYLAGGGKSREADAPDSFDSRAAKSAAKPLKGTAKTLPEIPPTTKAYLNEFFKSLRATYQAYVGMADIIEEAMGDTIWLECKMGEIENVLAAVQARRNQELSADEMRQYKPSNITDSIFTAFIDRVNNTRRYDADNTEAENRVHLDPLRDAVDRILDAEAQAVDAGYVNLQEWWETAYGETLNRLEEKSNSVCSSITLQIKQEMVLTRQAFRGTLTVFNGHESEPMTDMKLNLVVSDMFNNVATAHEFQMNAESLKNLDGPLTLDGGWTLAPNSEGTATVLFIPTKYAAPTEPVQWSFGGTLSYTDPYSGLEVTRELYPVTLTVKPSPELDLTYFMQRDLYGDDPLTPDVIEPTVPGEFALLINNKGYGDAANVRMTTNQPEIVENEKGLLIDFEIVSSQVNGGPAALSFGQTIANTLGDIPAHSQIYAQWWLQSSLLGHFTSYKVEATHVTSYGNEDLSLLDQVTIHELIHGFTPPAAEGATAPARAFLVNDVEDANDLPDQIYFTDATQQAVTTTQNTAVTKQSNSKYTLTVYPTQTGWTYASLLDPTVGRLKLLRVVRQSDGLELPADNVWQTSRSLRDGGEWLYENRLHIIGEMPVAGQSYELIFEERPDLELEIVAFSGVEYDPEYLKEGLVTSDVDEVKVQFSKPIDASTFTADDVTFRVQGELQDLSNMGISSEDNTTFALDLSSLNPQLPNGYYVLTVQTNDILDTEGFNGLVGKKIDWVLFRGGLIRLNAKPYPALAGDIGIVMLNARSTDPRFKEPATGGDVNSAQYGSQVQLTATPREGYEFVSWTIDGEVVSTDQVFVIAANADLNIVANFKPLQYRLEVAATDGGTLRGQGSGFYDYGTQLQVVAIPQEDFRFETWVVDGQPVEDDALNDTLSFTLTKATNVQAVFVRDIYRPTLTLSRGWNWVSTYLAEPQSLGDMARYANRVVGQTDELFVDPEFGLVGNIEALQPARAYKVEAQTTFSHTMRGHLHSGTIGVQRGWNWIAYPLSSAQTLAAIEGISEGDVITAQSGFAEYGDGTWEGTLAELTPGQGYLYKAADSGCLTFSEQAAAARPFAAPQLYTVSDNGDLSMLMRRYPSTMNVTARIYRDGMELTGEQYNVYAMAGQELRGVGQLVGQNHYLTVYGNDATGISFIVEDTETGQTFTAAESLMFHSDVVGSRRSPFALTLTNATGIHQLPVTPSATVYTLEGILVSRDAKLRTIHRLPKGVYIVNGKKVVVK